MKKIFVNTSYGSDANSFWRCMGPLSYLEKESSGEIEIHQPVDGTQINWDRLAKFDMIFMHRPCRQQDLTLLQMARMLNIPVWSDYDDWLFKLPEWNPHTKIYHQQGLQKIMATLIACSDVVTVSTTALMNQFEKINPRTIIIPNSYRSDLFNYRDKELKNRNEIFVWRGTNTHDGDVLPMASAFKRLSKKVHFLGGAPYSLTSQMDPNSYQKHDFVDPIIYWKTIHQLAPKVWLFPLKSDFFNECKSNISWIEAIHAGAICVAPDMPEWKHAGVITYKTDDANSFYDAAEQAMSMSEEEIRKNVASGYEEIKLKYDIKVINEYRSSVFKAIFHPSFEKNMKDPFNHLTGVWALGLMQGRSDNALE